MLWFLRLHSGFTKPLRGPSRHKRRKETDRPNPFLGDTQRGRGGAICRARNGCLLQGAVRLSYQNQAEAASTSLMDVECDVDRQRGVQLFIGVRARPRGR